MGRFRLALAAAAILVMGAAFDVRGQTPQMISGGGGLNLAVYEAGNPDGLAILFIHGFLGSHRTWGRQFSGPLADGFRLVAFDMRGHGASDKPLTAEDYTDSALWAKDLAAVIREKGLERPVLVGWSYAGYVMADYVRAFGDDSIGGLVFIGALTEAGTDRAQSFLGEELLEVFGGVLSPEAETRLESTRTLLGLLTATPLRSDASDVMLAGAMTVPPEVRGALFSRTLENDDVLAGVQVPTLVIQGVQDRLVRMSSAEHIAAAAGEAGLRRYEGSGHAPFLDETERFDSELAEFVRSADAGWSQ